MKIDPDAPADTRTMGIVHSALRRDLRRATIVLTSGAPPSEDRRRALGEHLVWMMSFLERHHTGEDTGLYPLVQRRNPDAQRLLDAMDAEHQQIHPAMERVEEVARAYAAGTAAAAAELVGAIADLEEVLYPHLKREEEEMMPVVSATITRADWHRWDQEHNIKPIGVSELAATGLWILDGQDPESDAVMSGLVPPLARFVIKRGLGPRYRRRAARLWGGTEAARVPALPADAVGGTDTTEAAR